MTPLCVPLTDPLNNITTMMHDIVNRLTAVIDANSHTTTSVYDSGSRLINTIVPLSTSPYGFAINAVTTMVYDPLNRVTSLTDANNHTTGAGYDTAGRRTVGIDALNFRTTTTYDNVDRPLSVTDPLNHTSG